MYRGQHRLHAILRKEQAKFQHMYRTYPYSLQENEILLLEIKQYNIPYFYHFTGLALLHGPVW